MKKKIAIIILAGLGLVLSTSAFAGEFGYPSGTTPPNSAFGPIGNIIAGTEYTLTDDNAEIQSISAWLRTTSPPQPAKAGIYDSSGNFVAGTNENNVTSDTPGTWFNFIFTENPVLNSGNYWLVVFGGGSIMLNWADNVGYTAEQETGITYNGFPATYSPSVVGTDKQAVIYATYNIVEVCDSEHLELCLTEIDCGNAGGYWYSGICNATPPPPPPPGEYFGITTGFATGTLAYIGQAVSGLGPFLFLIIGLPFAFIVIKKVIALVPKK